MKNQFLLPAVAAAIGFAVAWIAKPAPSSSDKEPAAVEQPAPRAPVRTSSNRPRAGSDNSKRPTEVSAGDFPLVELAEQGPKTRTEAKMLRLTEALDLSIDQQGDIIRIVEETKAMATDQVPVIEDFLTRGRAVEEALAQTLDADQLAKFEELRERERDNRIEARAQRALNEVISEIDISPGQRDEVLARLRQAAKAEIQAIPAAATLLLNTSILPTGPDDLSVDGVLILNELSTAPPSPDDPMEAHRIVLRRQRQELEEKLRCFDGILTPGQMGQYHAALAERKAIMDQLAAPRFGDDPVPPEAIPE